MAEENSLNIPEKEFFIFPVSFAQQRLWFLEQLAPGNPFYNVPATVRLCGSLNIVALEQTFNEIVRRHEALRTTFQQIGEQLVQALLPRLNIPLPIIDLQPLPEGERELEARRFAAQEAQQPFNLAQGPLLRVLLLQLGPTEHVLVLTMHHIVSDGWSIGVLLRELGILYAAFVKQQPSPLAELPIQYADFAQWQRQWLQGEVLNTQLTYWQQQLSNLPVLELPTDRSRPAVQSYRGATQYLELPRTLSQALEVMSQAEGVTLFMTLLAAFQTLLYRYTGQTDIVVGSPIANRNRREIEGLIGFFVNSLVLRTDLSGNPSFRELLSRVREVVLGAYAHQDLPFEKLVEELQPERNLSHMPLFQVMFALQSAPTAALDFVGLNLKFSEVENKTSKFDLTLSIENTEQGLKGSFEYNTDLFDSATITRMLAYFQTLLEGIAIAPEQQIAALPLLTAAEKQLLIAWNNTQADYPQDKCVHQLWEAQVNRSPDAIAIASANQQLTYQQLNHRANQLAHFLQKLNVGPEVLVCICLERVEMIVGLLAILKAGGAYLPLDPSYPEERLNSIIEDAQVPILLTQQRFEHLGQQAQVICLDKDWEAIAEQSQENPTSSVTAENLAYTIYTSGSTGKPKGVQVEHNSLLNLIFWHQKAFEVSFLDRTTQIANCAFDAFGWEIWPYLTAGASVHFPDQEILTSPEQLRDWLVSEAITLSFLPTPLAERILSCDWPKNTALRSLLTGGDKLHQYPPACLPFKVVNNYGPTENTVVTTSGLVVQAAGVPTIGQPIANTQVYLLDAQLQPVPIGARGELYISGDGLARGYLNRPDLTAESFIPHPFSSKPGTRIYRTGDLARYRSDGQIEFLGRMDEQVKIRGFRIELREIEWAMSQHPLVKERVVVVREDVPGDKQLVAYIVPHPQSASLVNTHDIRSVLRGFLKEKLPEYMIPSTFVVLEALPLTPNGKVDRRVKALELLKPELVKVDVTPQTPIEELLVKIWAEVLGLKQVGVHDNFFELGGHSLLATQLASRIRDAFQVDVPVRILFEAPTAAGIAEYIETIIWAAESQQTNLTSKREEVEF